MVSVTIVTWNSAKYLDECFASLSLQDYRDLGEGSLTLWLLVMGVNVPKWEAKASVWRVSGVQGPSS